MVLTCKLFYPFLGVFITFCILRVFPFVLNTEEDTQFEAAFQGRCTMSNPCEHFCYELHDGMYECDCKVGFILHTNGYSCSLINSTMDPTAAALISSKDEMEDIIYERDTTFLAKLELTTKHDVANSTVNNNNESKTESVTKYETTTVCGKSCGGIGTCILEPSDTDDSTSFSQRCQCPLGKAGLNCETDVEITTPRFYGQGWLAFAALRAAYKHVQMEIEFRPEKWNGIIFLTGERDDLAGDFISVLLHQGFIEFRFDCGSGVGVVRSDKTVLLNKWNKLTVYRHRWDAWIQLNNGKHVQGRSKGLFSRITFREPVFIGGRGNTSVLTDKIPTDEGFRGCIRYVEVNGVVYNFAAFPMGDALTGFDVDECTGDRCSSVPCKHGGKCLTADQPSFCLCPLGFTGDLCETRLDLQVPQFNGSSYLRYPGIGSESLSWLDLQLVVKPLSQDGIILYNGNRNDAVGDFIAVYISAGHLVFTFDLGTGSATLRSDWPVTLGDWHTLRISRTGRLAIMQVDKQPAVQVITPGAFTQLSLHLYLYIGGVSDFTVLSPKIKITSSFVGCIQKISINEKPLHILAEALTGVNIDNCPHPCLAKPCGNSIQTNCVPLMESYKCVCDRDCHAIDHNDVASTNYVSTFDGSSFLHYLDSEITKRIIQDNVSINMRFRTTSVMGLLLWFGSIGHNKDFLSVGVINGHIELSFNVGNGQVTLMYNQTRIDDGHWHRVNIFREVGGASLMVDNGEPMVKTSDGNLSQINAHNGLYIGGVENIEKITNYKYRKGIKGCMSDLVLNSDYFVKLSWREQDITLCV